MCVHDFDIKPDDRGSLWGRHPDNRICFAWPYEMQICIRRHPHAHSHSHHSALGFAARCSRSLAVWTRPSWCCCTALGLANLSCARGGRGRRGVAYPPSRLRFTLKAILKKNPCGSRTYCVPGEVTQYAQILSELPLSCPHTNSTVPPHCQVYFACGTR